MGSLDEELENLRRRHTLGDRLASLLGIVLCDENGASVPDWARHDAAEKIRKYTSGRASDLDAAFFGARLDGGRHAVSFRQACKRGDLTLR